MNRKWMGLSGLAVGVFLTLGIIGASRVVARPLPPPMVAAPLSPAMVDPESLASATPEERAEIAKRFSGLNAAFLASLPLPDKITLCGTPIPLDRADVREAILYELILSVGKPTMPLLWTRRAPNVLPAIEAQLKQRQLPDDLKYLPMIESDLRWTARSPANALGLWQFVDGTARRYGLRIDSFVDQRLDPDSSTDAGLRYLADLHREFDDWLLAFAAYNAGEGAVARALEEQGRRSYFDLFLPYETRRYVPRLIAAKLVYEQPESYGLVRMTPLYLTKYRFVQFNIQEAQGDLREIARKQGFDYSALRLANPHLKSAKLPKGKYRVRIAEQGDGAPVMEAP